MGIWANDSRGKIKLIGVRLRSDETPETSRVLSRALQPAFCATASLREVKG